MRRSVDREVVAGELHRAADAHAVAERGHARVDVREQDAVLGISFGVSRKE